MANARKIEPQPFLEPGELSLAPSECVLRHVTRTARAVVSAYDAALKETGLTGNQFNVLMTLREMDALTVGELASAVGMDGSTVPRMIEPLSAQGWIAIDTGADKRKRYLSLTRNGRRKIDSAEKRWRVIQASITERFGVTDWPGMITGLHRLHGAAANARRQDLGASPSAGSENSAKADKSA